MKSGIYIITNTINNKVYVGSAEFALERAMTHYKHARSPRVPNYNYDLEQDIRKYGYDAFQECVVEYCPMEELKYKEQEWINKFKPEQLYNKNNRRI